MAARKTVVYECDVCGTEVTVNSEGLSNLSPIYCCGISLGSKKKPAAKAAAKKTAGKSSVRKAKKAVQKKRSKK